ncbi:hypothetical protein ACQP2F_21275 [Actinoplanes sp. CA-030573]|uniref:hypothetical protein n=1 Tax=Actinoplanes sp. CA-030573 TaxID=3239898 RepID=UPI003D917965
MTEESTHTVDTTEEMSGTASSAEGGPASSWGDLREAIDDAAVDQTEPISRADRPEVESHAAVERHDGGDSRKW